MAAMEQILYEFMKCGLVRILLRNERTRIYFLYESR